MPYFVDRGTLVDSEQIGGIEMLSDETSYYLFERPDDSVTIISTGTTPRNQDWTLTIWFSEDVPGENALTRKFSLTPRANVRVGVQDEKILLLDADDNIILTIAEKISGRNFYLNLQNNAGKLNYYYINAL